MTGSWEHQTRAHRGSLVTLLTEVDPGFSLGLKRASKSICKGEDLGKTINISDVAADAGVSRTTVSHALSGNSPVSDATRKRVQESVHRLGYRPNLVARSLRLQRTHTVALLVVDIANPYYPALARSAIDGLAAKGYTTFIGNTDGKAETEQKLLEDSVARNADGIIITPMSLGFNHIRTIVGSTPLVIIGYTRATPVADMVSTLDAQGITEAVAHLCTSGRTDIAFVSGPVDHEPGPTRLNAFRDAANKAQITVPPTRILHTSFTRDGGHIAGATIFSQDPSTHPSAIICANDLIAIGVMDAAHERGIRIPEDVAIIGFDNIEITGLLTTKLTTIDNSAAEVGGKSADVLLKRIADPGATSFQVIELATRLIIRDST